MRILAAHPGPAFSVHDVYVGWVEALRELGITVPEFNLSDRLTFYGSVLVERPGPDGKPVVEPALNDGQVAELAINGLYAALYKTRPDVLLVVSGFFLPPELMDIVRSQGTRIVLLHTESPYEDDRQLARAGHADLNLLNDPLNLAAFAALAPSVYMPHAYRPAVHSPGPAVPALVCDLAFVGTAYDSRIAFLEAMDLDGLDVFLAGNWQTLDADSPLRPYVAHELDECLNNEQTVDVYRSARVGLNLYRREATPDATAAGHAMGPREVEMAACGLFFLRDPRPESDEILPMLPAVTTPGEATEQLRWWLTHPDERADAANAARAAVADRTFAANAARMLALLYA